MARLAWFPLSLVLLALIPGLASAAQPLPLLFDATTVTPTHAGVLVTRVSAGDAAAQVGMTPGMVIATLDDQQLASLDDLKTRVTAPGDHTLVYWAGEEQRQMRVTAGWIGIFGVPAVVGTAVRLVPEATRDLRRALTRPVAATWWYAFSMRGRVLGVEHVQFTARGAYLDEVQYDGGADTGGAHHLLEYGREGPAIVPRSYGFRTDGKPVYQAEDDGAGTWTFSGGPGSARILQVSCHAVIPQLLSTWLPAFIDHPQVGDVFHYHSLGAAGAGAHLIAIVATAEETVTPGKDPVRALRCDFWEMGQITKSVWVADDRVVLVEYGKARSAEISEQVAEGLVGPAASFTTLDGGTRQEPGDGK